MVFIATDIGFLLVVFLIFGFAAAASMLKWILDNLIIVGAIFAVKSLCIFGKTVFKKGQRPSNMLSSAVIILLDILRGVGTMVCGALVLDQVLSNGIIELFLGILVTIPIMGLFLYVASEGAIIIVYHYLADSARLLDARMKRNTIVCELISIGLLIGYYFVFQAMTT